MKVVMMNKKKMRAIMSKINRKAKKIKTKTLNKINKTKKTRSISMENK